MSHLLQLVIELALLTLLLGYKDGANNSFNDWFILNTELIQPCEIYLYKKKNRDGETETWKQRERDHKQNK